jgi:sterol 3beta-glucosyltransferase
MRIVIPTIGSRGDVQPYLALAAGLQRAGHAVTVVTHPMMRSLVTGHGLSFQPMGPDIDLGLEAARLRAGSSNWMLGFLRVMRFSFAMLEQCHGDLLTECCDADLVVVAHSGAGRMEADQLGLPNVSVTLMPQAIPAPDPSASIFQKLAASLAGGAMGLMLTRPVNQIRRRQGLPPMGREGITSSASIWSPSAQWSTRRIHCGKSATR